MSTDKSKSLEKKQKHFADLMAKFYNFVNQLSVLLLPEYPNELDVKEVKYISEYLNQHFAQVVDQQQLYRRLPILSITFYGDHRGHVMVCVDPSQDKEIAVNFRLVKFVKDIEALTNTWDLDRDKPPPEKTEKHDMTPYMAIQEHIDKGEK